MATSLAPGLPVLQCSRILGDMRGDAQQLEKTPSSSESCPEAVPWDPLGCWRSLSMVSTWRPSGEQQLPGTFNPNPKELKKAVPGAQMLAGAKP